MVVNTHTFVSLQICRLLIRPSLVDRFLRVLCKWQDLRKHRNSLQVFAGEGSSPLRDAHRISNGLCSKARTL